MCSLPRLGGQTPANKPVGSAKTSKQILHISITRQARPHRIFFLTQTSNTACRESQRIPMVFLVFMVSNCTVTHMFKNMLLARAERQCFPPEQEAHFWVNVNVLLAKAGSMVLQTHAPRSIEKHSCKHAGMSQTQIHQICKHQRSNLQKNTKNQKIRKIRKIIKIRK